MIYAFLVKKYETGMGIYAVLDGCWNVYHVFRRRGRVGDSADCRDIIAFVSFVFVLSAQKKNRHIYDGSYICLLGSLNFTRSEAGSTNI